MTVHEKGPFHIPMRQPRRKIGLSNAYQRLLSFSRAFEAAAEYG